MDTARLTSVAPGTELPMTTHLLLTYIIIIQCDDIVILLLDVDILLILKRTALIYWFILSSSTFIPVSYCVLLLTPPLHLSLDMSSNQL